MHPMLWSDRICRHRFLNRTGTDSSGCSTCKKIPTCEKNSLGCSVRPMYVEGRARPALCRQIRARRRGHGHGDGRRGGLFPARLAR